MSWYRCSSVGIQAFAFAGELLAPDLLEVAVVRQSTEFEDGFSADYMIDFPGIRLARRAREPKIRV